MPAGPSMPQYENYPEVTSSEIKVFILSAFWLVKLKLIP